MSYKIFNLKNTTAINKLNEIEGDIKNIEGSIQNIQDMQTSGITNLSTILHSGESFVLPTVLYLNFLQISVFDINNSVILQKNGILSSIAPHAHFQRHYGHLGSSLQP